MLPQPLHRLLPAVALALAACAPAGIEPTLDSIQENVFAWSCSSSSCHGGNVPQNGLDLTDADAAFENLVDVPAVDADGWVRVLPGDPDASLLAAVLEGPVEDVAQMPKQSGTLDGEQIDAIRQWIADGALR